MINYDYWRNRGGAGDRPYRRGEYYEAPAGGDQMASTQPTGSPTPAGGYGYNPGPIDQMFTGQGGTGQMGYGEYPFPPLWNQAEDFYSQLMSGGFNVGMPPIWGAAQSGLMDMMQGGQPVDIAGWIAAQNPVMQQSMEDMTFNALESAGIAGTRSGSGANRNVADMGRQLQQNMFAEGAGLQLQAEEAAKARMMQAFGLAPDMSSVYGQNQFQNIANQMAGAQGAMGLGQQQMFAPLQLASGMMGLGNQYMGAEQSMYNNMQDDPYLLAALQAFGGGSQYMPEQYTPGWGTQMLNMGGSLMSPWLAQNMGAPQGGGNMQYNPYYGNMFNNPYGG